MPPFTAGQTLVTREPRIVVDPGLKVGEHTFQLIVVNDRGVESLPVETKVTIVKPG